MEFTNEWIAKVAKVEELVNKANLTDEQMDRIFSVGDPWIDHNDRKKTSDRLTYWAKKIGLDIAEKWWIFEWTMG